ATLTPPTSSAAAKPTENGFQPRPRNFASPVPSPTAAMAIVRHQTAATSEAFKKLDQCARDIIPKAGLFAPPRSPTERKHAIRANPITNNGTAWCHFWRFPADFVPLER